jgi:hypothetical protein
MADQCTDMESALEALEELENMADQIPVGLLPKYMNQLETISDCLVKMSSMTDEIKKLGEKIFAHDARIRAIEHTSRKLKNAPSVWPPIVQGIR